MMRSAARSKVTWVAMLVALVLGFAHLVVLTSPGLHPKPAQAQTTSPRATLIVDNTQIASFTEFGELTSSMTVPKLPSGTGEQLPTNPQRKPMRIVLERPVNGQMEVAAWYNAVRDGQAGITRKTVTLVIYDASGTPIMKFRLENAWPAEYHIEQQGSQVVERVRLTAESFERMSPSAP